MGFNRDPVVTWWKEGGVAVLQSEQCSPDLNVEILTPMTTLPGDGALGEHKTSSPGLVLALRLDDVIIAAPQINTYTC